jgi:hypothetical protein
MTGHMPFPAVLRQSSNRTEGMVRVVVRRRLVGVALINIAITSISGIGLISPPEAGNG